MSFDEFGMNAINMPSICWVNWGLTWIVRTEYLSIRVQLGMMVKDESDTYLCLHVSFPTHLEILRMERCAFLVFSSLCVSSWFVSPFCAQGLVANIIGNALPLRKHDLPHDMKEKSSCSIWNVFEDDMDCKFLVSKIELSLCFHIYSRKRLS